MANATLTTHGSRSRTSTDDGSRRRYVVNRDLLLITLVIIVLAGPAAYLWYTHQLGRTASLLLQRAEQLEQQQHWSRATTYYQRYLLMEPEDTEALVRMVEVYAKGEPTPGRVLRLTGMLYQAVGRAPERDDLRLMLAENLLKLGDFAEAEKEAAKLAGNTSAEGPLVRRVIALAKLGQTRVGGFVTLATAAQVLVAVAEELPADVGLAVVTANLLREHPTAVELDDIDPASYADQIMDRLIAADPASVEALLVRYRYRRKYGLSDPQRDLQAALEIAPNHVEALLLAAELALSTGDTTDQPETLLRRAVSVAPRDPRAYVILARLLEQSGNLDGALELLRQGRSQMANDIDLGMALAQVLIEARDLKEAERVLGNVESESSRLLGRVNSALRTQMENRLRLLRAKIQLANGEHKAAISDLQAIRYSAVENRPNGVSAEWLQSTRILAQIMASLGYWDKAAEYWGSLAAARPADASIIQSTAAAFLRAKDANRAIQCLETYHQFADLTADMLVQLVRAHFVVQVGRPLANRNWTEFSRALATAKADAADRWEVVFAEVHYLIASEPIPPRTNADAPNAAALSEPRRRAYEILRDAEGKYSDQPKFWSGAAQAYRRLDQEDDVDRAVARYLAGESSPVNQANLKVALLLDEDRFEDAEEFLVALVPSLAGAERRAVQRLRLESFVAANELSRARQLVGELIAAAPSDARLLAMGIEICLGVGDLRSAEQWETVLKRQGSREFEWRYLRALRLLGNYDELDRGRRKELVSLVADVRAQRSRWYPAVALAARHAQLTGDSRRALSDYRLAVDLGDRRPRTLEKLVSLLYQYDRLGEAVEYLSRLTSQQPDDTAFDTLAIRLAVKQNRLAEALALAKQSVERRPEDAMRYIWLANLLLRNDQSQEAVEVYRQAGERFPDDSQVWKGLFTLFVKTRRTEDAREVLAALLERKSLPEGSRHFLAAQGFELLGDFQEAKEHYEQAIVEKPDDVAILLHNAKFLLKIDTVAATAAFEEVLKHAPENSEARRELASLLAATGRETGWVRARQLLERQADDSPANVATNDRQRAVLLARLGRTRSERLGNCRAAREILQQQLNSSGGEGSDINRRLLAAIYEQESVMSGDHSSLFAAREQLRYLVDRDNPSPRNLTLYLEFLMRHATSESMTTAAESGSADLAAKVSELREIFLRDAESRLRDLRRAQTSRGMVADDNLENVELTVRLSLARGRDEEAEKYVADYVKRQVRESQDRGNKAQLYLATGSLYATLGQHAEAESWYRRLMKIVPRAYVTVVQSLVDQGRQKEAVELCLSVAGAQPDPEEAIVLARIMMAPTDRVKDLTEARSAIEAAVVKHSDNIDLLQAEAVMRASLGEYDRAIAAFRRVIELNPDNALAMNNLATLLAERPNQRAEALELVERAIEIAGRRAALLDTQGTIFLKKGNVLQAISCLEEATAGGATDARYYFHLAAAYDLASRNEEALNALQTSRDYGLQKTVLTEDDLSLLARLDRNLGQRLVVPVLAR